jgi:ribosomal protein L17
MMNERVRAAIGGIDWIRAGQVLGVPAMGMLFLLMIGFYFVRMQATQWANDSETRQELLKELVTAQIKQGEATTTTMVRAQQSMEKLERIAAEQTTSHTIMIETQRSVIQNQSDIINGIKNDCDATKELIAVQKRILDHLGPGKTRPVPAPVPKSGGT